MVLTRDIVFLWFWRLKSECQHGQLLQRVLLLSCTWLPSCCVSTLLTDRNRDGPRRTFSYQDTNPILRVPTLWSHLDLVTSHSPQLQKPSHWGLQYTEIHNVWISGWRKGSVCNTGIWKVEHWKSWILSKESVHYIYSASLPIKLRYNGIVLFLILSYAMLTYSMKRKIQLKSLKELPNFPHVEFTISEFFWHRVADNFLQTSYVSPSVLVIQHPFEEIIKEQEMQNQPTFDYCLKFYLPGPGDVA